MLELAAAALRDCFPEQFYSRKSSSEKPKEINPHVECDRAAFRSCRGLNGVSPQFMDMRAKKDAIILKSKGSLASDRCC
jgi:hypothetical protein